MEATPVIDLAALLPSVSLPSPLPLQSQPASTLPESGSQNQDFLAILQNLTALVPEDTLPVIEHVLLPSTVPLAENATKQAEPQRAEQQQTILQMLEQGQNVEWGTLSEIPHSPERVQPEGSPEIVIGSKNLPQPMPVAPAQDSERVPERTAEGVQKSQELLTPKMIQSSEASVLERPVEDGFESVKNLQPQEWLTKTVSRDVQARDRDVQPLKPEWMPQTTQANSVVLNQQASLAASQAPDVKSFSADVTINQTSQPQPSSQMNEPQPMRLKDFQKFPQSMSERLSWMVNREQKVANIRLDPPELGKLQVQLKVDGDQVSVQFQTSGNAVRDLILQQVDRLRMAMSANDMQLVDVNVSTSDQPHKQDTQAHSAESSVSTFMVDESTDDSGGLVRAKASLYGSGLLDTFA